MDPSDIDMQAFGTPIVYVQYKGVWDMQDLYESIANFFRRKKFKFYEEQQRHRKPGPFGAEVEYRLFATRKIEDFYRWSVHVIIETFDVYDVDVVLKDGTKKKMAKGRLWVQIYGKVDVDYEKAWEKSAFMLQLKNFYNKYVIKKKYEGVWWDELYYNIVLKVHAVIRERLKMTSEGYEHRYFSRVH